MSESQVVAVAPALRRGRWWLTLAASALALCAAAVIVAYLQPARYGTGGNLVLAFVVLFAPLAARPPWTRERLLIAALVWVGVGVPGGYVFGTPVSYAGVLLGTALLVDQLVQRVCVRASAKSLGCVPTS